MANDYWVIAHYDNRFGTNWAGVDEDRVVAEHRSFAWSDLRADGDAFARWLRRTGLDFRFPLLVIDHTDGNRVVSIIRNPRDDKADERVLSPWEREHPVRSFYERDHEVIAKWKELMVPYTVTTKAMAEGWAPLPLEESQRKAREERV